MNNILDKILKPHTKQTTFNLESTHLDTSVEISRMVRDESYKQVMHDPETDTQREVIESIILQHPEGITDTELCIESGISKSSVTARRNEISWVKPIGIAVIYDEYGNRRMNTLWG
jgi:hypothetical protein